MSEYIIAALLGAIMLILYVELRQSARAHDRLVKEIEKLDRRMQLATDQMASNVRELRRVIEGEGT